MNLLRLKIKTVMSELLFVLYFLRSSLARDFYSQNAHRAIGQARLDTKDLSALEIPLPPLSEQRRIAAMLKEKMAAVERLRKALEEQWKAVNKLPAAILRRAFSGEL